MADRETQTKATVNANGSFGLEKLSNGSCESTTDWESNTAFGSFVAATLGTTSSSPSPHGGSFSLSVAWGSASLPSSMNHVAITGLTVGAAYRLIGYVYVPSGSPNVMPHVIFGPAGPVVTTKNAWALSDWSFVATSDAAFLGWRTEGNSSGGNMYLDDVSFKLAGGPYTITVDGATVPCPAAALDNGAYAVGQRVTVTVRNPLPPLIAGAET